MLFTTCTTSRSPPHLNLSYATTTRSRPADVPTAEMASSKMKKGKVQQSKKALKAALQAQLNINALLQQSQPVANAGGKAQKTQKVHKAAAQGKLGMTATVEPSLRSRKKKKKAAKAARAAKAEEAAKAVQAAHARLHPKIKPAVGTQMSKKQKKKASEGM